MLPVCGAGRSVATLAGVDHDHYAVLGVEEHVDRRTLRAAYLARMRLHHPDRRPGDPGHTARALNEAYAVLRDPERRAAYDRLRRARRGGGAQLSSPDAPTTAAASTAARTAAHRSARSPRNPDAPRGTRTVDRAAYSEQSGQHYRRVSASLLRVGGAVFVLGLVLLALLS